jgi:hypothetical protein
MRKRSSRAIRSKSLDQALIEAQRQADFWRERVEVLVRAKRVIDEDMASLIAGRIADARTFAAASSARRPEHPKKNQIDPTSNVGQAIAVLRDFGAPTHIRKIIDEIEARTGRRLNQHGIVGSISQYVREKRIFFRPEPNTFGLLEWRNGKVND